jgi:phenylalanyl-tRNA synthetase beta chain
MIPEAMASAMIGSRPVEELASQVLRRGRGLWIKARGGSMTPFLRDGDVAFVMPAGDEPRAGDVEAAIRAEAGPLLRHLMLFDLFRLPDGRRSLAWRLTFQADDRTLTDEEVNTVNERAAARVSQQFGITRRGGNG